MHCSSARPWNEFSSSGLLLLVSATCVYLSVGAPCRDLLSGCTSDPRQSPYSLSDDGLTSYQNKNYTCFSLLVNSSACSGACCTMEVDSVEFTILSSCQSQITQTLVAGTGDNASLRPAGSPVWRAFTSTSSDGANATGIPDARAFLVIPRLGFTQAALAAAIHQVKLCISMEGTCDSLQALSGMATSTIRYSIVSPANTGGLSSCCPASLLSSASITPSPPPAAPPQAAPPAQPLPSSLSSPPSPYVAPFPYFPYIACKHDTHTYSWRASSVQGVLQLDPSKAEGAATRLCMFLAINATLARVCNPRFDCCSQGLQEVHFVTNADCTDAVSNVTMNGVALPSGSAYFLPVAASHGYSTWSFTNLNLTYDDGALGKMLCWQPAGTCTSWSTLFAWNNMIATVSTNKACCPVDGVTTF